MLESPLDEPLADTANTLNCGLNFLLLHFGHEALSRPNTSASNSCLHSWQMYSKIGIHHSPDFLITTRPRNLASLHSTWYNTKRQKTKCIQSRASECGASWSLRGPSIQTVRPPLNTKKNKMIPLRSARIQNFDPGNRQLGLTALPAETRMRSTMSDFRSLRQISVLACCCSPAHVSSGIGRLLT